MKRILLYSVFFVSLILMNSCMSSQEMPAEEDLSVEEVINFEGMDKNTLYDLANRWFVESFGSAEAVIEYQDKDTGVIMGKFILPVSALGPYGLSRINRMKVTIQIDLKDSAARIKLMNPSIYLSGSYVSGWKAPTAEELSNVKFAEECKGTINDFKIYIENSNPAW